MGAALLLFTTLQDMYKNPQRTLKWTTAQKEANVTIIPTAECGCSIHFCRNEERPKCRKCGVTDKQAVYITKVQAWKLSDSFYPLPNTVGDTHAYVCMKCYNENKKSTYVQGGATRCSSSSSSSSSSSNSTSIASDSSDNSNTDDEDKMDFAEIKQRMCPDDTIPHIRDEPFLKKREKWNSITNKHQMRNEMRLRKGTAKWFTVTHNGSKQVYNAITRLVDTADAENEKMLEFMASKQQAIARDADLEFVRSRELRKQRILELALSNKDHREFMCVVLRESEPQSGDFSVPVASIIFTFNGRKAEMDVNILDQESPVVAPVHRISLRSVKKAHAAEQAARIRVLHIDMVYVDPDFGGNGLAKRMLLYIEDISPDNTVYMGFFTGMHNEPMQRSGMGAGMHPNSSRLPPGYRIGGFDTSFMKALSPNPSFAHHHHSMKYL
eukprot:3934795-Rhodomonas_salina.2